MGSLIGKLMKNKIYCEKLTKTNNNLKRKSYIRAKWSNMFKFILTFCSRDISSKGSLQLCHIKDIDLVSAKGNREMSIRRAFRGNSCLVISSIYMTQFSIKFGAKITWQYKKQTH